MHIARVSAVWAVGWVGLIMRRWLEQERRASYSLPFHCGTFPFSSAIQRRGMRKPLLAFGSSAFYIM